jgi:WD40 repeat protein
VLPPGEQDGFTFIAKHRQPVTAVALSKDSDRGFSASKDGVIMHWDVETGKCEKYLWPSEKVLLSHHAKAPSSKKRSQHILALAVSSDGRYLATGGMDRHIHLWDVRSREHIQVRYSLAVSDIRELCYQNLKLMCFVKLCEVMTGLRYSHICVLYVRVNTGYNQNINRGKPPIVHPRWFLEMLLPLQRSLLV